MGETDPADPKGLIREAFRIDGITLAECRSIFVDWALSLPPGMTPEAALRRLVARHKDAPSEHPMLAVMREGFEIPVRTGRRGGRAGRLS